MGLADFMIKLGLNTQTFTSGKDKAKADIKDLASTIDGTFDGFKSFGKGLFDKFAGPASIAGALLGIGKFVHMQGEAATEIKKTARAMDTQTDAAQRLTQVSEKFDLDPSKTKEGISEIRKTQSEALLGNKGPIDEYARLGVTLDDLKNKNSEEIFMQIARGVESGAISAANYSSVLKVMGGQAKELIPIFQDGFASMNDELEKTGPIIERSVIDTLSGVDKAIHRAWSSTKAWGGYIAANLAGGLINAGKGLAGFVAAIPAALGSEKAAAFRDRMATDRELSGDKDNDAALNLQDKLKSQLDKKEGLRTEKKRQDEAKNAEQAKKDEEEAARLKEKNDIKLTSMRLSKLSKADQLDELTRRRDGLSADIADAKTPLQREKMRAEILEADEQISALNKSGSSEKGISLARAGDSLSKIGLYRGGVQDVAQVAARQQAATMQQQLSELKTVVHELQRLREDVNKP